MDLYRGRLRIRKNSTASGSVSRAVVILVVLQNRFVILAAVEHAKNGNHLGVYVEGDHCAFLVVGYAQARPYLISSGAAKGERAHALAMAQMASVYRRGMSGDAASEI